MKEGTDLLDRLTPRGVFYGWYIAIAGAGSCFIIFAFTTHGFGVFIKEFQNEFGWSLSAIALGFSIRSLEAGALSPFTGYLVDRLGPRRMAISGVVITAASMALLSQTHTLLIYYVASVGIALGTSLGSMGAYSAVLMRWFNKRRGVAFAVLSIGVGAAYFGALIMGIMIEFLGWRGTMLLTSALILLFGIPLGLVVRDKPEDRGYLPDGALLRPMSGRDLRKEDPPRAQSLSGFEVREALRTPAFYLLTLMQAAGQGAVTVWITFQIPHLLNVGFSVRVAGMAAALYGLCQIILRFGLGWAGDRFGRRRVFIGGYLFLALGMGLFSFVSPERSWLLPIVPVVFGVGNAASSIGSNTLAADYFGTKRFATIRGLMASLTVPVGIGVPLFIGAMVDHSGDYRSALRIVAAVALSGVLWLALVRRPMWDDIPVETAEPREEPASPTHAGVG